MKYQPHGGRVDANQAKIVRELRVMGFRVDNVSQLKKLYDLVVTGRMGTTKDIRSLRVEIKMPGEKLSSDEEEYWAADLFPETLIIAYSTKDILLWFRRI